MKSILVFTVVFSSAIATGQPAVDTLKQSLKKYRSGQPEQIELLNEIAFRLRRSHQDTAVKYAKTALELAERSKYYKGVGAANITLSVVYHTRSVYEKSLQHALTAVKVFDELKDKKGLMDGYLVLGLAYSHLKNKETAEGYFNLSLTMAIELNHPVGMARAYNALGNLISNNPSVPSSNKQARELYTKALESLNDNNRETVKINILGSLGYTYLVEEKPLVAKPLLEQAMKLAQELNDPYTQVYIHLLLGKLQMKMGNMIEAEQQLLAGEKLAFRCGERNYLLSIYMSLIELKSKLGKDSEMRVYEIRYNSVCDSLFSINLTQQIAELELYHEATKKENTIQLLQREKKIEVLWRYLLIGGVLMTLITSVIVYRLQQSRAQKARELLKTQKALNTQLQEVDKLKSNFFANISHEFRTPLTLILAPLEQEIQKRSKGDKGFLQLMKRNAGRLLELVNQLLDLSKLEAGKMQVRVSRGEIANFCTVLASSFDSLAQQKQIQYVKKIDLPTIEAWFDSDKVEKILTNLLANAFKFTPVGGTITLTLEIKHDAEKLFIAVADTGRGIPKSEQEKVFSAFYQVRPAIDGHEIGTGLGLSLVRELVRIYGGSISLESIEGLGTVFNVELPINKKTFSQEQINNNTSQFVTKPSVNVSLEIEQEHESDTEEGEEKESILVIEDNTDLRDYMCSILKKEFNIMTANDGHQGLAQAVKDVPSLVLTDLMMPIMDGMILTEKLKTNETTCHIPVIMLTARSEHEAKIQGLKAGADDYLTKPFSTEELLVRVKNLISIRKKLSERYRQHILVPAILTEEASLDDKFLFRVREIVENNLHDVSFSVEKLAEEIYLSRTQLLRKLKALTGLSPTDFIKDMRLQKAANMIRQKVDTVTQIGYAVGFNDQSYFTKCFKKAYGMTPTEYAHNPVRHEIQNGIL